MMSLSPNKMKGSSKMKSSRNNNLETEIKAKTQAKESLNKDLRGERSFITSNEETDQSPKLQEGVIMTPVKQYKSKQNI